MSKIQNVKIIAVIALIIGANLAGLTQLDQETKMIAGEELRKLCSEHLVTSNFNFFENMKKHIINYSYNDIDTSKLTVILNSEFEIVKKKIDAVAVLQKNLEYVYALKVCYKSAPVSTGEHKEKESFKKMVANKTKSNCLSFHDPVFINRLARNNLVFNMRHIINSIDLRRKLLDPKTPLYKFTLEGLKIFSNDISKTIDYEMEDYEYYLLEMFRNSEAKRLENDNLNSLVKKSLQTHMVDFELGAYACDIYETILFTFREYVMKAQMGDANGFGKKLDEHRNNFEFVSKVVRVDTFSAKFSEPLCGKSPKSGQEIRQSGLIIDNLSMSVHNYFFNGVLNIESYVPKDIDKTVVLEFLYDYVIDQTDDEITFWDFDLVHEGVEEIVYFDFSFMEFFTHFKKGIADEDIFIESETYRKIYLDIKKGDYIHFDYNFYQLLAKYFKVFMNEFAGNEEFPIDNYKYMVFESTKLIYKVYTFLRFKKIIIKGDDLKITIQKILKFFLDRENFEDFEYYFDNFLEEMQQFFVVSYTYLLRIYLIEFYQMTDQTKFNDILEKNKTELLPFYNPEKLLKLAPEYLNFEYLTILVKIIKITIFQKIYKTINSIKFIEELHQTEPELQTEIKTNWKKTNSRVANRRSVYKHAFVTESKPNIQKIINEDVTKKDIRYIFNFIKEKKGQEVKIPLKRILMRNLLLKTQEKRDEIYGEIKTEITIELYALLSSRHTEIEYFIQFLDWMRKTHPPQFYGNLYKNTDFAPTFTTVLLSDFYFIVPKCLQIMANLENKKVEANPSYKKNPVVGNCSDANEEECRLQAYWLLGNDFSPQNFTENKAVFENKLFDYMEQLTFLVKMLPIFKHFRIVLSESMHKYNNEVREIFRDIYSFMISLRAHMYIVDDCPWETMFDGLEECLEFTYSRHYDSNSESVHMCNFSYQRYSEMYWFLKYFQMEETSNDELFFHLFTDEKRAEIEKKADNKLTLEEKKLYYPHFTRINRFHIFLSYIVDVQKLPKNVANSNEGEEESAKSRVLRACENHMHKKFMFCEVLKSVLTIQGELQGEDSGDSYNLITQQIQGNPDGKFVVWNSITILHDMSLYRGLDYFEKLNSAHDNFFSVDYFYANKQKKTAVDPIFTIESADMINYVDFIKMKFKPSPGFLQDFQFIYEVVKEIITKHKTTHLNELFFMTPENIEKQGAMGIGESVAVFLMFCDTDAFYTELAQKLVKVPDYVLYSNKQKADLFIPQLNMRLSAVTTITERITIFLEYFPSRLNKKIELVNPAFAKEQGKSELQEQKKIIIPTLIIRKKGGIKKQILAKGEKLSTNRNIDLVAEDRTLKIEGTTKLTNFDPAALLSKLKTGKTENIDESQFGAIVTKTIVMKTTHHFVKTNPIVISQEEFVIDGGMTTNQAIIRQSFKSMGNSSVKNEMMDDIVMKSRSFSTTKIEKKAHVVMERNYKMALMKDMLTDQMGKGIVGNGKILKKLLI